MYRAPTRWLVPAALAFLILGLFVAQPVTEVSGATDEDANFVFEVYDKLEKNYYDPDVIKYPALLNQALAGVKEVLKNGGVNFIFEAIPDSVDKEAAKNLFRKEMRKAVDLSQAKGGFKKDDLAFAAASYLLGSLNSSHTHFLTSEEYQEFKLRISGRQSFVGIGVMVAKLEDGFIYIHHVFNGAPSDQAGLKRFDRFVAIDGKAVTNDLEEMVSWIKGNPGEFVVITVERGGNKLDFKIKRERINAPTFNGKIIKKDGKKFGHLTLYGFNDGASDLMQSFMIQHKDVDGWILDLRGNAGGYVYEMMAIVEYFLPAKTLVFSSKNKQGKEDYYINARSMPLTQKSVLVLIDGGSASGSEITAGAIQDNKRGIVVGVKSAGATEVSHIAALSRGAAMKIATDQVFTPQGLNIEGSGITPNEEVKMTKEDILQSKDRQLDKALELLSK